MDKLMTIDEVATQLQVSPRTIQRWIRMEGLPVIKIARAVRIDAKDLAVWLAQRKQGDHAHG